MRTFNILILLLILASCNKRNESFIILNNDIELDHKTLIKAEGIKEDSIVTFEVCNSYLYNDTLLLEFVNNNGWQDRRIHLEIFKDFIQGWEYYGDDISNRVTEIKPIHLENNINNWSIGKQLNGKLNFYIQREDGTKTTYQGDFTSEILILDEYERKILLNDPTGQKTYQ